MVRISGTIIDIIYVYPGDGTTTGLGGITLQNYQKLWGTGIIQSLATTHGMLKVPVLSPGYPNIGPDSGAIIAVTFANGNELSGIYSEAHQPVYCSGVHDVLVHNNIFGPAIGIRIFFQDLSGEIIYQNNMLIANSTPTTGIIINYTTTQEVQYSINHNQFLGNSTSSDGSFAIQWSTVNKINQMTISNNTFTYFGGATGGAAIGSPFASDFTDLARITLANNTFSNCGAGGFNIGTVHFPIRVSADLQLLVLNNRWTDSQAGSASLSVLSDSAAGQACAFFSGNQSDASKTFGGSEGAYFMNFGGTTSNFFSAEIDSNNVGNFALNNVTIESCP